jgi:hypothetical protein
MVVGEASEMNIYAVKERNFTNFITYLDSNRKKEKGKNRTVVGEAGEMHALINIFYFPRPINNN